MVFEPAAIHDDEEAGVLCAFGGCVINHAFLEPDGFRSNLDCFVNDCARLFGASKHIHEVDLDGHIGE
jgi:hypothetical protein